jgi:hypothetical protein
MVFQIEERLKYGTLSLDELAGLSGRSKQSLEMDVKLGKLRVKKMGDKAQSQVRVPGPEAQRYLGLAVDV